VIPSSSHKAPTSVSGSRIAACASRSLAGVIFGLRPPLWPRARADASPAHVRSQINSRSNSASAAKMPKTSFPAGVVVSIAAPWPVRTLRPTPREVRYCVREVVRIATEAVKLPHDEGSASLAQFELAIC
jgi:hypothetical protein